MRFLTRTYDCDPSLVPRDKLLKVLSRQDQLIAASMVRVLQELQFHIAEGYFTHVKTDA